MRPSGPAWSPGAEPNLVSLLEPERLPADDGAGPDFRPAQILHDGGVAAGTRGAARIAANTVACDACVPCEKFRRKTFTPAREQLFEDISRTPRRDRRWR